MLAITVAVRVDVYGVFYTCALGIFLLVPRGSGKVWVMVWVAYMVVHGCLLIIQYFFLLGIPEDKSYCLAEEHGESKFYHVKLTSEYKNGEDDFLRFIIKSCY